LGAADSNRDGGELHVATVLEQLGNEAMRENFWNYGQCGALQCAFKEPPEELSLREFLATADSVRWGAVLPHLLRPLLLLCPSAVRAAYQQVRPSQLSVSMATICQACSRVHTATQYASRTARGRACR
jgi:hypothetical protein